MSKKKIVKVSTIIISSLLGLLVLLFLLLNSPFVQTQLARAFVKNQFEKNFNYQTQIGEVHLRFFAPRIELKNVVVIDDRGEVIAQIGQLQADLRKFSSKELVVSQLHLDRTQFHVRKYADDSMSNFARILDFYVPPKTGDTTPGFRLLFEQVFFAQVDISYRNDQRAMGEDYRYVDYDFARAEQLSLVARQLEIKEGRVIGDIRSLTFKERSGLNVNKFSSRIWIHGDTLEVRNTQLETDRSVLDFDMRFTAGSWLDYRDFVHRVHIDADIRRSVLDMQDIAFFAPSMEGMNNRLKLSSQVSGTVAHLRTKNLEVYFGQATQFVGDVSVKGLPSFEESYFSLSTRHFTAMASDLEEFYLPGKKRLSIPPQLARLGHVRIIGEFEGYPTDFQAKAEFSSPLGLLEADMNLRTDGEKGRFAFSGNVASKTFALGAFLEEPLLGNMSVVGNVEGLLSEGKEPELSMDVRLSNFEVNHRSIESIEIKGGYVDGLLSAMLTADDPHGTLSAKGDVCFHQGKQSVDIYARLDEVDLTHFGLIFDSLPVLLSTELLADFKNFSINDAEGIAKLNQMQLRVGDSIFRMKQLIALQRRTDQGKNTQVNCDYLSLGIAGQYNFLKWQEVWDEVIDRYFSTLGGHLQLPQFASLKPQTEDSARSYQRFDVMLKVLKTDGLFAHYLPQVNLPKGGELGLRMDMSDLDKTVVGFHFDDASLWGARMKFIDAVGKSGPEGFVFDLRAHQLVLGASNYFEDFTLKTKVQDNDLLWNADWTGMPDAARFEGHFAGVFKVLSSSQFEGLITASELYFGNAVWKIDEENLLQIDSVGMNFHNFKFYNSQQEEAFLSVNGWISKSQKEKPLSVQLSRIDLSSIDRLTEKMGMDFDGYMTGKLEIYTLLDNPYFNAELEVDTFSINQFYYGKAFLTTRFDNPAKGMYVRFEVANEEQEDGHHLLATGYYYPQSLKNNLDIAIQVSSLDLSLIRNYVNSFSSDIRGKAVGDFLLKGSLKNPRFEGLLHTEAAKLKIDYLNTVYDLKGGEISFSLQEIGFKDIALESASSPGGGVFSGKITHDVFKKFALDLSLQFEKFVVMNTTREMNEAFYGKAFASGLAKLSGPVDHLLIDVVGRTEKGTEISIPYDNKVSISDGNFVTFVVRDDENGTQEIRTRPFNNNAIEIRLNLVVTPEATILFDMNIPPTYGLINATGSGIMRMEVDRAGQFKMFGDYTFQDGYYDFSLQNLVSRRFNIERGGTVKWTGNPGDALIDMQAVYSTRASLFPILSENYLAEMSDGQKRKVNVQSVIGLAGKLSQAAIKFDIRLPNVDEDTRTQFFSLVNKENEGEMTKQTFYLLLFNSFTSLGGNSSIATTGVSNITAASAASEVLSNQINAILSKISSDLSLGVNYKPDDINSTQQVQFTFSTQQFDNRLIIDAHVGYGGTSKDIAVDAQNYNELMGEVNFEYRVTDRLSLRAFNRSNERDLLRMETGYTQGLGVSYKRQFDSFHNLFRKREKKKKKKKEEVELVPETTTESSETSY